MSDYIKREDVLDFLDGIWDCNDMVFDKDECDRAADCNACRWRDTKAFIRKRIAAFPAADVVERKRGEWIYNPKDALEAMFTLPKCSLCGHESSDARNYCPNCGADMREETE